MASTSAYPLVNSIPIDHRLKPLLERVRESKPGSPGFHANTLRGFGSRLANVSPDEHKFAARLAQPVAKGGVVFALLQPPENLKYTSQYHEVVQNYESLQFLDQTLKAIKLDNGVDQVSVFHAFPFLSTPVSIRPPLSEEASKSYATFSNMMEAKKPDVIFSAWKLSKFHDHESFCFATKGPGAEDNESSQETNGHKVKIVHGFDPSYAQNHYSNDSCFSSLFTLEVIKAFCLAKGNWSEEPWMKDLRARCRDRIRRLPDSERSKHSSRFDVL
jgi:hypothetical protein